MVCSGGVWDLRRSGAEVVPLSSGVTALDASGDVVCAASGSRLELWDCGAGANDYVCICCVVLF